MEDVEGVRAPPSHSSRASGRCEPEAKGKHGLDSFASPCDLQEILREWSIDCVMICGFLTNCCVESTMRSAYERGLDVFVLTDCCAAMGQAAHEASVEHNLPLFSVPCLGSEVEFEGPRRTAGSSS